MAKFLNDINLSAGNDIQFRTTAGVKAGKIEQDGDNLVLTNAVGDVLLGDGSSDIFIGDGTNNVDIIFEQSGAIKGDGSAVTLTLGGANTTLNLSNPNITGNLSLNATTINDNFTFTGSNGFILFDYEPQAGSNTEYTNEAPLIKLDRSGTPISVLSRMSVNGALAIGRDDTVAITAGDTFSMIKDNINYAAEQVILSSENGFYAYGWPKNMESPYNNWSSRNEFRWRTDSETASNNGLYIGVNGSTQFIDTSRNLKNIGTISSGAITSTGKIQGTELEGTSLDINGTADVSGNAVFHGNTGFGGTGSYRVHAIGTGWAGNGVAIQSTTTNGAVLTLVNTDKNFQIASRGSTLDFRDVSDNDTRRFFVDSTGNLQPGADSSYTLGTNGNRWSNVFADTSTATTFSGDLNGTINTTTTATTQSAGNNSTKVATTAYVDTAVSNLVDTAPPALNTLNELAAALGDDVNFSTTVTNSIAGKVAKSGDTMTGQLLINHDNGLRLGDTANATTARTTLTSFNEGGNSRMKIKGGNFVHSTRFETSWNNFEYAEINSSYNGSDTTFNLYKSNTDAAVAATTTISTGTSTFAGNVVLNTGSLTIPEYIYHSGDTTNYHRFLSDRQIFVVGNASSIDLNNGVSTFGSSSAATTLQGSALAFTGAATFNSTIGSGAITSTGKIQSSAAEAQLELASSHGRTTTLQQGGGHFHIFADHASGVAINYGKTNEGLLRLYNNTTAAITLDATGGTIATSGNITATGDVIATDGSDTSTLKSSGLVLSRSNSYIQSDADNSDTLNIGQSSVRWGHVKVDGADFAVLNGGNERFKVNSSGNATFQGDISNSHSSSGRSLSLSQGSNFRGSNHLLIQADSSYVHIKSPNNQIFVDGSAHNFRNGDASANYLVLSSTAATFSTNVTAGSNSLTAGSLDINGSADIAGNLQVTQNAATMNLVGTDHSYIQWFPDGISDGRKAFTGFGGATDNGFSIVNEISGGNVKINTNGGTIQLQDNTVVTGELQATSLDINGNADISGHLSVDTVTNSTVDLDKFLVIDSGNRIYYRTGAESLLDIGGVAKSGDTMTGDLTISSTAPNLILEDTNGRSIEMDVNGNTFRIDDVGNNAAIFTADLSANPVQTTFGGPLSAGSYSLTGGSLDINGNADISGALTLGGSVTVTGNVVANGTTLTGDQDLSSLQPKPSEGAFANGDKTKLDGIATSATANSDDETLLTRSNHTGTQAASTISDFDTEVSNNTTVVSNQELASGALQKDGGTMTGALTLSGAPTSNLHAATKAYVDANAGGGGGSSFTDINVAGNIIHTGDTDTKITFGTNTITIGTAGNAQLGLSSDDVTVKDNLLFTSAAGQLQFTGTNGGGNEGITYKDSTGSNKYAMLFPGSNRVAITNRASSGKVQIRANNSTAGASGEVTVVQFEHDKIDFQKPIHLTAGATPSDPDSGKAVIYLDSSGNVKVKISGEEGTVTRTLAAFEQAEGGG